MEKYLIVDIDPPPDAGLLNEFTRFGLTVLDGQDMTSRVLNWGGWRQFNPAKTLVVFPGNGASIVKTYMPQDWLWGWPWRANVHAKRHWIPGEHAQAVANRIFDGVIVGMTDIVVIDDVVSSGETARRLRQVNLPWIPAASWHLVTWVAQRAAALKGFISSHAVCEVGAKNQKVPINSLSTLLAESQIAASYAQRNFYEPDKFLQLLEKCRSGS